MTLIRLSLLAGLCLAASPALAGGCDANASKTWSPDGGATTYTIDAVTVGPDCANAVALLTIRAADGSLRYQDSFETAYVMLLGDKADPSAMKTGLEEWVDVSNSSLDNTGKLPKWAEGADAPEAGEFPFYPDPGVDQSYYEELRAANQPMLCFVQGMESSACLAFADDGFTLVGDQSFPG